MRIGILGTRGIPNYHGGFEQFAEFFSVYLAEKGEDVFVYNSSLHPYKEQSFKGVNLISCNDPEDKLGTAGQFIYDLNCIRDARKRKFDVILQLGYTSSTIWWWLMPKKAVVITNMDGLEWKRSKYSKKVQRFLRYAEKLGAQHSDLLVADSSGIQAYLKNKYQKDAVYIAYGANVFTEPDSTVLNEFGVEAEKYSLLIARFEPENNLEMILDGIETAASHEPFLVIGKSDNNFGAYLRNKFSHSHKIKFTGGIYNLNKLDNLRYFSRMYFHGHSVGGTNPSLLEAMASNALICAHHNEFNKGVLKENAFYFSDKSTVSELYDSVKKSDYNHWLTANTHKIQNEFNWNLICEKYYQLIKNARKL